MVHLRQRPLPPLSTLLLFTLLWPTHGAPTKPTPATWPTCSDSISTDLECAEVGVPMSYDNPSGERISLKVLKLPASNKTSRKGSLVYQLGGPGIVTSELLLGDEQSLRDIFGKAHEYFDIVVSDPRGVGLNHPVTCNPEYGGTKPNAFPRNKQEYVEVLEFNGRMGEECLKRTGKIMNHMDSRTQGADLQAVRVAIGEGPLNYYGVSWGSLRGFHYAEQFPNNLRAVILDGLVDHSISTVAMTVSQAQTYSLTLRRMLNWMSTSPDFVLQGEAFVDVWRDLVERADQEPIPAPDCVGFTTCFPTVNGNDIRYNVFESVTAPVFWPSMALSIHEAYRNGNASGLASKKTSSPTGSAGSQNAVICQDWDWTPHSDWDDYLKTQYMSAAGSLDTQSSNAARVWALACPRWPTKVTNPSGSKRVQNSQANPVMLVHSLWDPNTAYEAALGVQGQIDDSVLQTRYGEGHGSWGYDETFEVMFEYLAELNLPSEPALVGKPTAPVEWDFERMGWDTV